MYLKESYNPLIAFLYGWSFFAIIQTGTIAAVGVAFSKFTAYLIPAVSEDIVFLSIGTFTVSPAQLLSIVVLVVLTFINTRGVKGGTTLQTSLTIIKLVSLFGLIAFGLIMMKGDVWRENWADAWNLQKMAGPGNFESYTFAAALGAIAVRFLESQLSGTLGAVWPLIAGLLFMLSVLALPRGVFGEILARLKGH